MQYISIWCTLGSCIYLPERSLFLYYLLLPSGAPPSNVSFPILLTFANVDIELPPPLTIVETLIKKCCERKTDEMPYTAQTVDDIWKDNGSASVS